MLLTAFFIGDPSVLELVFQAKKRTGDYHGQMDCDNLSKWFTHQLLLNITSNSIIIMDNAKYHNVLIDGAFPTSKTLKRQMQEWLSKNNYPWTEDMLKPELFALCKRLAPSPEFNLDQIAEAQGHTILRIPQSHPELQPIETCWAIVKNYMEDKCDFTMDSLRINLPEAFKKVTSLTCKMVIAKVVEQEEKFWKEGEQIDNLNKVDEEMDFFSESNLVDEDYDEYGE